LGEKKRMMKKWNGREFCQSNLFDSRQAIVQISEPYILLFSGQLEIGLRALIIKESPIRTNLDLPHLTMKNASGQKAAHPGRPNGTWKDFDRIEKLSNGITL
jgi:hypothetical protein